ncbi:Fibronectin type III domain-containing protein [Desulfocicer vacuolatum DSM 3385]|uniref:Fibronectin type III domain-containing protein n=1 Tax=Desulfocicer vacuolatum DSM 3385 TaxID=1121400 RepID=A0A1W1ZP05_9BACT|nr:fibronectin type III domain-containing protein [Desulfocicer vacuolatum]SMC50126.1 Fibronectin type III domain-containing protein [Desulfocicer vacuolatum DSM 3385]
MIIKFRTVMFSFLLAMVFNAILFAAEPSLQWDPATGDVTGYKIYYGTSPDDHSLTVDVGNVLELPLSTLNLTEGNTYYFTLKAYNSAGESRESNLLIYTVPLPGDSTPPLSPQDLTAQADGANIRLSWSDTQTDVIEYRVYYGSASRDYGLPISTHDQNYIFYNVDAQKSYYFSVTSVDGAGNESGYSSPEVTLTIPEDTSGVGKSVLKWDAASGVVDGYRIYFGTSVNLLSSSVDVGNVLQYAFENLKLASGTTYHFVVRAYNAAGEGTSSNVVQFTTSGDITTNVDTLAPVVSISFPTSDAFMVVDVPSVDVKGSATDDEGVVSVSWINSTGGSGTASGTTSWSTSEINLVEGINVITVKAQDAAGNESTATLSVTYTPPAPPAPVQWTVLTQDNFESGWGSYVDGGGDCSRTSTKYSHQGSYAAQIRDNSGTVSSFYSAQGVNLDGPGYTELKIEFWFYPRSMESGEDFFVEYYDGTRWHTVATYVAGSDFSNNSFYQEEGIVLTKGAPYAFPTAMKLRFRCDASGNYDYIYIDEIIVSAR